MFVSIEILDLFLYFVQQLGIMVALGAESVLLFSYLLAVRDGIFDEKEKRFAQAANAFLARGLWAIVLSGVAITALHILRGQLEVVFTPVFLFKWLLVAVVCVAHLARMKKPFRSFVLEGAVGATWHALFLVHVFVPLVPWANLFVLFAGWMLAYTFVWTVLVYTTSPKDKKPFAIKLPKLPKRKVLALANMPQTIELPRPQVQKQKPILQIGHQAVLELAPPQVPEITPDPPPAPERSWQWLPGLHIMPKSPEDIDKRHRAPLVTSN